MQLNNIQNTDVPDISIEDIKADLKDAFKEVYVDGHHIATMTQYDYDAYNKTFPGTVEEDAMELYTNEKERLLEQYPGKGIGSIIGFLLSQKLYEAETD